MPLTMPLVLSPDTVLTPIAELPASLRDRIEGQPEDVALSRRHQRTPTRVVDADAADLVREFTEPTTIVDAIIRYSRNRALSPDSTLDEAYPFLADLVSAQVLVDATSAAAETRDSALEPGTSLGDFVLDAPIQVLGESEVHRAIGPDGTTVAIKLSRAGAPPYLEMLLQHEARVLKMLDGHESPILLGQGRTDEGHTWIAMTWCAGVPAPVMAAHQRSRGAAGWADLLRLGRNVAGAYRNLHARGVVHGDVHPNNVLVDTDGTVTLIDFGLARVADDGEQPASFPRGGVGFFLPPDYARAMLEHRSPPAPSYASEQYAVGAMLDFLISGDYYRPFDLGEQAMCHQIVEEPPRTFAERGVGSWPALEVILRRALAKEERDRFPSMGDFAAALATVEPPETRQVPPPVHVDHPPVPGMLDELRPEICLAGAIDHPVLPAPAASVYYGAAGLAIAGAHLAISTADPMWLAVADLWSSRAEQVTRQLPDRAFVNPAFEITPETVGPISLYHSPTGVHATRAIVAALADDPFGATMAVSSFLAAAEVPDDRLDLTLGRSGLLLGCALLLDHFPDDLRLVEFGSSLASDLLQRIEALGPIAECETIDTFGMAHGWAGLLYAQLRWAEAVGSPVPDLQERLAELRRFGQETGDRLTWPWLVPGTGRPPASMPGWCNGSAGHLHLWTLAYDLYGEPSYLNIALRLGIDTAQGSDSVGNLCCGSAGRSYALLNLWRHTGDDAWLRQAHELAQQAATILRNPPPGVDPATLPRLSLYKGALGLAVLEADLGQPDTARMPLFEQPA